MLFGGVSIFGGRGTIVGVVLSVAIVGSLQMALTQINVSADKQNIVTGVLLLISVIVPNGGEALRRLARPHPSPSRGPRLTHDPAPFHRIRPHHPTQEGNTMTGIQTARRMAVAAVSRHARRRRARRLQLDQQQLGDIAAHRRRQRDRHVGAAHRRPSGSGGATTIKKGLKVYFIPKDTQNPYEVLADKGGQKALSELGGTVTVSSGTAGHRGRADPVDPGGHPGPRRRDRHRRQRPVGAVPDAEHRRRRPASRSSSFDSDITCGSSPNHLFINQADTETDRHVRGRPAGQADQLDR